MLAVLANPPVSSGTRTRRQIQVASELMGCDRFEIGNLFPIPTRDIPAIASVGRDESLWLLGRQAIRESLAVADVVLGGWGITRLSGQAQLHFQEQVAWFVLALDEAGVGEVWMVGGVPRHPSRWHRYVSDKHGRVEPGTPHERLAQVLVPVSVGQLRADVLGVTPIGVRALESG